jgi:hypothetical protein
MNEQDNAVMTKAIDDIIIINHGYESGDKEEQDAMNADVDALLEDEQLDSGSIRSLMEAAYQAGLTAGRS